MIFTWWGGGSGGTPVPGTGLTFVQLYGDELDRELASSDRTQLFTTARRKRAINDAQDKFARMTECTKRYASISITTGVAEYNLNEFDFIHLLGAPSIKIVSGATTRYMQGPDGFPRREVEELDFNEPGWRAASSGQPSSWYLRVDGAAVFLGVSPPPSVTGTDVWTWIVPYLADPPDMVADGAYPFTIGGSTNTSLNSYYLALVHYAAAQLEPLRKNYSGVTRQMQLYSGYVAQYLQTARRHGRDQIALVRNYYGESRSTRARDPHSWP